MTTVGNISFLNDAYSRRAIRLFTLGVYFILFQILILLQKPFLQFDFIFKFYLVFGFIFTHHLFEYIRLLDKSEKNSDIFSYLLDFAVLMFFMRYFPYLSSFILVLQLFLLFIASFDLNTFELSILGFALSLGTSIINLSTYQAGSIQSILSLTLFNLSYLSVIIVSRQLRVDIHILQTGLAQTWKKWKSQEEFSRSLLEKLPFGLAVMQSEDEIVMQNSYLAEKLNLQNSKIQELISVYKKRNSEAASDIINNHRVYNFDHTTYYDEVINENLELYLIKDVTDLRRLEFQLKQKEKLAAVGTLAAGIAHEIRNPLAGISGSIQMLSEETTDATQKKLMSIVLKEIDRLNTLITEFLDYAKPEKNPDSEIDLKKIIEDVVSSLKQHPELPVGFDWKLELNSAVILGFSEKMKQALLNIMINAIQAMKLSSQPRLEIKLSKSDKNIFLSIKDTGCGMNEESIKKMFEPFHTTKPKGTGLGLAITHKILDLHKAQIEINSELGTGTEFNIKFPRHGEV